MKRRKRIALTTGDRHGVGFEVTAKALASFAGSKKTPPLFFVFRHASQEKIQPRYFKLIDKNWLRLSFDSLEEAFSFVDAVESKLPRHVLIDLTLSSSEAEWVVEAARASRAGKFDALVTGPLSKKTTAALPGKALGHTGIFRQLFPDRDLFMAFLGKDFHVLLATDHRPLATVEKELLKTGLGPALKAARQFQRYLKSAKKFGVLGFNPHAGEAGLIGKTERLLFRRLPPDAVGPLVPDAAFLKTNREKYSFLLCLYHDQGLIPFKMHHGQDSGVHLTLGLPFIRTSVDHGTAYDLFNKNVANPNSMLEAMKLGLKLTGA